MFKSLRNKLLLSFLIISVCLSAVSIFGYYKYAEQGQRMKHLASTDLAQMETILKINNLFRDKVSFTKSNAIDVSSLTRKRIEKSQKTILNLLLQAQQKVVDDQSGEKNQYKHYIEQLISLHKKYDTKLEQLVKAKAAGNAVLSEELNSDTLQQMVNRFKL